MFSVLRQCAVCSVQCEVCSVQDTVYSVQCAVYSMLCEVCSLQCAAVGVQCDFSVQLVVIIVVYLLCTFLHNYKTPCLCSDHGVVGSSNSELAKRYVIIIKTYFAPLSQTQKNIPNHITYFALIKQTCNGPNLDQHETRAWTVRQTF